MPVILDFHHWFRSFNPEAGTDAFARNTQQNGAHQRLDRTKYQGQHRYDVFQVLLPILQKGKLVLLFIEGDIRKETNVRIKQPDFSDFMTSHYSPCKLLEFHLVSIQLVYYITEPTIYTTTNPLLYVDMPQDRSIYC